MEFKHIEYFLEASRHKSMSQAAESLYISQQALSRCVQNLETELGCKLFQRSAKGSVLTKEGKYLKDTLEPQVNAWHQAVEEATRHLSAQPHQVILASSPMMFSVLDTNMLYNFKETHPQTQLELNEMADADVARYVQEAPDHLGIIAEPEYRLQGRFEYTIVKSYPLCVCLHKDHPLAGKATLSFEELLNERFLALDKRSHYQQMMKEAAAKYGFTPNVVYETADVNQICNLINSGKGICVATNSPAFGTIFPNIRAIPLSDREMLYSIAFIYQRLDKLEPQARSFIEFVRKAQKEYPVEV